MRRRNMWIAAGATAAVLATGGAGMAVAGSGDSEAPITGDALEKASAAALEHTRGGRVTDTEVGDEEGYYEVEITLDDGSQLDVHLDEEFRVIGDEADSDEDADDDDDGDRDG